jgi:hypothetical protein
MLILAELIGKFVMYHQVNKWSNALYKIKLILGYLYMSKHIVNKVRNLL